MWSWSVAGARLLDAVAATDSRIIACVGDVTDEADVVRVFSELGPFDIVVANAGAAESAPFTATSIDLWQRMLAVNLTGVFLTFREGLRQMRGRGWGRLITVASTAGLKGYSYVSAYTAAKHGAVGLTRAVAQEVAGIGNHGQRPLPWLPEHGDDRTDASPTSSRRPAAATPTRWTRSSARTRSAA